MQTPEKPEPARERLLGVKMVFVTAPSHAPARLSGPITQCALAEHVQLVLTDRTDLSQGQEFKVLSPRNSRLADLGAKHAFLRAGLGWGGMPFAMVERDLADGLLVEIKLQDEQADGFIMPMFATYRTNSPPAPAGRWLIDELKACEPVDGGVGAASALTPTEDSQSGRSSRCCGHGSNRDRLPQYGLCRTAIRPFSDRDWTYLAFFSGPHRQPLSENIQSRARLARVPYGGCSATWIDEIRPCWNTGLSFEKVRKPS